MFWGGDSAGRCKWRDIEETIIRSVGLGQSKWYVRDSKRRQNMNRYDTLQYCVRVNRTWEWCVKKWRGHVQDLFLNNCRNQIWQTTVWTLVVSSKTGHSGDKNDKIVKVVMGVCTHYLLPKVNYDSIHNWLPLSCFLHFCEETMRRWSNENGRRCNDQATWLFYCFV